ncbi:MAG TPA: cation transporter [Actinomycetota bacterium]|nr:cation transporter [Actinomycetota bacterium]
MQTRPLQLRRGLRLEWFAISWNVVETGVGLWAGLAAGSVALVGFALDSVVEASCAAVLIWRLSTEASGRRTHEEAERGAIGAVAVAFFLLAGYIGVRSVSDLLSGARPEESLPGMALAGVSLVVMPVLAHLKRKSAAELGSRSMHADSRQTTLCTYLSAVLLAGLAANALFGWWWADPAAGLVVAALAAREGQELWSTRNVCC